MTPILVAAAPWPFLSGHGDVPPMAINPSTSTCAPPGIVSIVDQDEASARRIADLLAKVGVEVQAYPSAGSFLSRPTPDPDCVICEMTLPDMTGIDLIRALRDRGSLTPVILLAAGGDVSAAVDGMRAGAVDFLEKAAADRLLARHVSRLIRRNRAPVARSDS